MFKKLILLLALGTMLVPQMVFAQNTLLPEGGVSSSFCKSAYIESGAAGQAEAIKRLEDTKYFRDHPSERNTILSCAIKLGYVKLWMLPYFIAYIANFFIGIAGIISVLFVVLGGFWYMTGGLTDDKEKGKKTITYALIGLAITMLSWVLVNIVQVAVT